MSDIVAPGPLPGEVRASEWSRLQPYLDEVNSRADTAITRLGELIQARQSGYSARFSDWSGPLRDDFDGQFPAAQAELSALIDEIQALKVTARRAVSARAEAREQEAQGGGVWV